MRISLIVGTLITGISAYIVLSYLLVPPRITFPISMFMSSLSFGLVRYYFISYKNNVDIRYGSNDSSDSSKNIDLDRNKIKGGLSISNIIFVFVFFASLVICSVFSKPDLEHIYTSWYAIGMIELVTLGAAIILSFFIPGYAVLLLLTKRYRVNPVLKVLIAYLFSMLITGLIIYLSEIFFDHDASGNKTLLIGVYAAILALFVISYRNKIILTNTNRYHISYRIISNIYAKFVNVLKVNFSELLVFGSLFALLIVSTNYLYGGITIGDQWYHQNRIFYFLSGQFKEYVLTNGDEIYPPFQSALIAGVTTLSGIPLVNTYASIAFLNMTAVFAFYYFCSTWFPDSSKRAALLASSLFVISSGFGWVYIISLTETNPITSQISSISNFLDDKIKFTDIIRPANFMIAAHPDFSTGLIYISLPAGFVLLGLVRAKISNKLCYTIILSLVTILGILSHDEFYFFIIASSTLPLIYNMQKKYSVYFALLFALAFTYTIDALLPVRYFTTNDIFGFPLIQLTTVFTLITLSLYILRQNLHKGFYLFTISSFKSGKIFTDYIRRNNLILKAISVGTIFYLYALCFIIWDQLPANLVDMHTQNYSTPWYVYPLRLGIIGLIGVVSILSYAFRRFEKEVFVFGLIIIIALLAGPYYDEQRFNKYVMAGMIGFASLLVFKLLLFTADKRPILNGIIVSSLVISASLSTLMYIGYNALVIQTGDITHALGRRNFPSEEELNMLDMLRSKIQVGSNHYNIASYPNEYNFQEGGIMTKLHAFSGMPTLKIPQTHYLLNASTLESFYHLIEKTNTKYIVIPSNSSNQLTLGDPARFAFENFQHIYDDGNYLLLKVPSLRGPSTTPTESEVGIIYKKDKPYVIPAPDKKKLSFSNYTFNLKKNDMKFIHVQKENQSEKATLYGYKAKGGKTIWSKDLEDKGINYIDSMFRIRGENKTGEDTAGLKWREGNTTYTVSLSNKGLELRRQLSSDDPTLLLSQNSEIKRNDGVWYSLKIENLENSINVYVDNLLKIKIPRDPPEKLTGISKVALYSAKNAVEFEPIEIAKIVPSEESFQRKSKYDNYYPVSSLALSGSRYSTFAEDDYSVLSKNIIVLPFDPQYWDDTIVNNYLNYVRSGGTLVVINSDDNIDGRFSKLLSMQVRSNNTEKFTDIVKANDENVFLNVSGFARDIDIKPSSDTNGIAYYRNDQNKLMKPFAIEKHFTNSGRIIYINSEGYFNAIYNNPKEYFASLGRFSDLFDSYPNKSASVIPQNVSGPIKRFIGNVEMSGIISINGSSFSIINSSTNSHNIEVKAASILDKNGNLKNHFENLSIENMKLAGQYEVSIDSLGSLAMPGPLTQRDYVQMSLPNGFNMTLKLFDKDSHAEIFTKNNSSIDTIEINDESKIVFYKVMSESPVKSVPVIVKNPLVVVDGNTKFEKSNFYYRMSYLPLNVSGHVEARFDFIDDLKESYGNGTKIQYLSYLGALSLDGKIKQASQLFKLPGGIPSDLKKRGLDVPLNSILGSPSNIALVVAISIGTMTLIWSMRRLQPERQQ
jgi:hypothetical protein